MVRGKVLVSYFLNWMGPVSLRWYEANGIPYREVRSKISSDVIVKDYTERYCCGRIDLSGVPEQPYGVEYFVPIMSEKSWEELGNWLTKLNTTDVLSYAEILEKFLEDTGHDIGWWNSEEKT